jgi:RHH-type proline utilization regulon transcriptional repressor/proline dehydrogenase/delta 1-pyrroline-5-carboxylate dehydrogenase
MDETEAVEYLLQQINLSDEAKVRISMRAKQLVTEIRRQHLGKGGLDAFLQQYNLSSEQGVALMCLAEALLRIPDQETVTKLIRDKIIAADWQAHLGKSESLFVNAATWGLMFTGKIMSGGKTRSANLITVLKRLVDSSGKLVVRKAIREAMKILGQQFVMGETINEALKRARKMEKKGYRYSYDMLGEAARTAKDADKYFRAYELAIIAISKAATSKSVIENPGISVKLSALYPRYEFSQHDRAVAAVAPRLLSLAKQAKQGNISLFVDAEEADRLDLSLDIIEQVFCDPSLEGWEGFGLAVQSYQKRAWYCLDWLAELARSQQRRIMVRLIKGAYWDAEIKVSQERGLEGYPVFTRKAATDVSFLACAQKILAHPEAFYAAFATHNAHSVSAIIEMAGDRQDYEFQCLHGMGEVLYAQIVTTDQSSRPCRIYAPVGSHEDLLPYLVRRLLENGANSSFVNRIVDAKAPIEDIIIDPTEKIRHFSQKPHPKIPNPRNLFGTGRKNSLGFDLSNSEQLNQMADQMISALKQNWHAEPTSAKTSLVQQASAIYDPTDRRRLVGWVTEANDVDIEYALSIASANAQEWAQTSVNTRAEYLEKAADLFEQHRAELMTLAVREAGKTIADAIAEVREAVDFCRYYAEQARKVFAATRMPGPTGEENWLQCHGRGPIVCISPWNFPLAIFCGQVTAALAAGNPVLAKPAEQTPLIAAYAVRLLHEAGVPPTILQLLPGRGEIVGARLVADLRVKGVIFTGSTETACAINKVIAGRSGPIIPLIAETGGQNALIVDSSALPEQVVVDAINSAFNSAGQRCSALRVLFLQEEIAPKVISMLTGAMAELQVGDPGLLTTDIGPVIDADAKAMLETHAERMNKEGKLLYQVALPSEAKEGTFFAPRAFEINNLSQLSREVFGPILHIIRYKTEELDAVIQAINATGYGLTLGVHSRIGETVDYILKRVHVGNCYVNRNIVGAVVGVQPFGGEGLSGTGPKAGGPHYLYRLCTERSISVNTTAAGGNASLMCLSDE